MLSKNYGFIQKIFLSRATALIVARGSSCGRTSFNALITNVLNAPAMFSSFLSGWSTIVLLWSVRVENGDLLANFCREQQGHFKAEVKSACQRFWSKASVLLWRHSAPLANGDVFRGTVQGVPLNRKRQDTSSTKGRFSVTSCSWGEGEVTHVDFRTE